jgi:hypothetical protein
LRAGEFLALFCELGTNHGIGFEPDYSPNPQVSLGGMEAAFRSELFTEDTVAGPTDHIERTEGHEDRPGDAGGFSGGDTDA